MKTLPVSWSTFIARRRLQVKEWLSSNDITNYKELVKILKSKGIEPPLEKDVEKYFRKPKRAKATIKKAEPIVEEKIIVEEKVEEVEEKPLTKKDFNDTILFEPKKEQTKKRRGRPKKLHISEDE